MNTKLEVYKSNKRCGVRGFTLMELLVVVTIMGVLMGASIPAINGLKSSGDFNRNLFNLAGTLEQARSYAMANNTYVYVGIEEIDGGKPVANGNTSGTGRVMVVVKASKDGTRGYDINNPSATDDNTFDSSLSPLGKMVVMDNMSLAQSGNLSSQNGMIRPNLDSASYDLAQNNADSAKEVIWKPTNLTFSKVIQFDPQGIARIQTDSNGDTVPPLIEIGLRESKGNTVLSKGQQAALQIAGVTGAVRVYRP